MGSSWGCHGRFDNSKSREGQELQETPRRLTNSAKIARRLGESTIFKGPGEHVEAFLRLSWAIFGPFWGHLGPSRGHLWQSWSQNEVKLALRNTQMATRGPKNGHKRPEEWPHKARRPFCGSALGPGMARVLERGGGRCSSMRKVPGDFATFSTKHRILQGFLLVPRCCAGDVPYFNRFNRILNRISKA